MKRQFLPLLFAVYLGSTSPTVFSQSVSSRSILDDLIIKALNLSESKVTKIADCEKDFQKATNDLQKDPSKSSEQKKDILETLINGKQEYIETILTEESGANSSVEYANTDIKVPKCRHIYRRKEFKFPKLKIDGIDVENYQKALIKKYMTYGNKISGDIISLNPNKLPSVLRRKDLDGEARFRRLIKKHQTWTHCYSARDEASTESIKTEYLLYNGMVDF